MSQILSNLVAHISHLLSIRDALQASLSVPALSNGALVLLGMLSLPLCWNFTTNHCRTVGLLNGAGALCDWSTRRAHIPLCRVRAGLLELGHRNLQRTRASLRLCISCSKQARAPYIHVFGERPSTASAREKLVQVDPAVCYDVASPRESYAKLYGALSYCGRHDCCRGKGKLRFLVKSSS